MKQQGAKGWLLHDVKNRGVTAYIIAALLFAFYFALYVGQYHEAPSGPYQHFQAFLYPATAALDSLGAMIFSPLGPDKWGNPFGSRWSVYGLLYTLAITLGGIYMIFKYKHNKYLIVRTSVVIFIQISFAFSIPILLKFFHQPEYYFSYLWPLKIDYLDPRNFAYYGPVYVLYGFFASLVLVPIMTVLYGKRWYCSWVCGCGGLANTFGEPWRHLSTKSNLSWQIEKVTINAVLLIAFVSTAIWFASATMPENAALAETAGTFREYYGIIVVAMLSGVFGVGLYPIAGTRFWCRFACPMAALLGLIQKFGRYRIKVKRDMCISCGMCSKYCEMGIDVRAYAQTNVSFTRASCVGCGLCAEVCPRGVLRLENVWRKDPQEMLTMESFISERWKGENTTIGARQ